MQKRLHKTRPNDVELLKNEGGDIVDRIAALMRIASDHLYEHEDYIKTLLYHPSDHMRGEAGTVLLGLWEKAEYLPIVISQLGGDVSVIARTSAADALGLYATPAYTWQPPQKERKICINALVAGLQNDPDPFVQKACYRNLIIALRPKNLDEFDLPDYFDRQRDVNWDFLKDYL